MEPVGIMPHSQGSFNNSYSEANQPNSSYWMPLLHLHLGLPIGIFSVGLSIKILRALLPSFILSIWPAHLNLLDLITPTIRVLNERYKLLSSSLWSLPYSPFSSILSPNIRLRIPFSNTVWLNSSQENVLHIHIAQLAIILFYIF